MKRNKIVSILEYSARNKMLVGILAVSLIGAGGVFLSSNAALSNNTIGINKTVLAGTLNNDGNKACVINGNDSLVLYTSASNSNIQSYISVGEMLTINSYSNGYYNITVQETGATGYVAASNMQKIVSGVGYDLTSLSGTAYTTNVSTVVNLREEATMNSTTLAKLKNNTSITLLGKQGDWYKVDDNGTTGYIYGEYIAIANTSSNITTNSSSSSATTSSTTSKTTGVTSNSSSSSSTKATSAKSSTSTTGTTSNAGGSSNQTSRIAYVYQPTGDGEAGVYHYVPYTIQTSASAFETALESGTKITVLGEFGDNYNIEFYKIEFGNNEIGYIPTKYVSFTKPESSSSSSSRTAGTTKTINSYEYIATDCNHVPILSEPNSASAVLKTLISQTKVYVYSESDGWSYVNYNGIKGYVYSNELQTTQVADSNGQGDGILVYRVGFIPSTVTGKVYMMSKESDDSTVVATLTAGESFYVNMEGDGWASVQLGHKTGFIPTSDITYTNPHIKWWLNDK